jgi:hypothetical protein
MARSLVEGRGESLGESDCIYIFYICLLPPSLLQLFDAGVGRRMSEKVPKLQGFNFN